jgi:hypothetical protein
LLLALNGMGATSDQCQCESDKDLTVFEIGDHEYLPTTAQAIAAPYKFPPTTSVTGVLATPFKRIAMPLWIWK